MTPAQLTYTSNPAQVAISAAGSTSEVGITFSIVNKGPAAVSIVQIVLTIPQGDGGTDLIAANTTFTTGSVHSSNGSSWSLSTAMNEAILMPVSGQGFAALASGDSLQFTLSGLQINTVGAGRNASIAVLESIYNGGDGSTQIPIQKIAPGFFIESFTLSQYNVGYGSPVTVAWKVVGALSCSITAAIVHMGPKRSDRTGPGCGVGTANQVCNGTISTGTDFSDSHTCNVEGATVFTLTAQGKGVSGDVTLSSQLLVTVNEPAINFIGFPPGPSKGQDVVVKWVSADAGKLQLYSLPSPGQPSSRDITGTPVGTATLQPLVNTNYFLYAFTNAGDTLPTKQSEFYVTVEQPQWTTALAVGNVPSPAYPGDVVTLNWALVNVDHCDLTCDQPGFAPQNNLPIAGARQVTLPDPGVANAVAKFTLTPVQFGGLGNFTPQAMTVPITNQPHFSQNLAAKPAAMAASGGSCTLTWAVDHADAAVLTSNLPGATPQTVDPSSGSRVVQIPAIVIPTPVVYTLTASRHDGKYTAAASTTAQLEGEVTVLWPGGSESNPGTTYFDSLYIRHPNQRIRKIQLNSRSDGDHGLCGILVWYSDGVDADYVIACSDNSAVGKSASMTIPAGDALCYIETSAAPITDMQLQTTQGRSVEAGSPDGNNASSSFDPGDQQAIAITWEIENDRFVRIGLMVCTPTYGQ